MGQLEGREALREGLHYAQSAQRGILISYRDLDTCRTARSRRFPNGLSITVARNNRLFILNVWGRCRPDDLNSDVLA